MHEIESSFADLDNLLAEIAENESKDHTEAYALDIMRYSMFEFTYKVLRLLTRGHDVKLTYEIGKPFNGMGVISLETKENLIFTDIKWFSRAVEFTNNFNVYPLVNGNTRMDFTFYGVTKKLKLREDE